MKSRNLGKQFLWVAATAVFFALVLTWHSQQNQVVASAGDAPDQSATTAVKPLQIDLDKAVEVSLPAANQELQPLPFNTSDGKTGWLIKIPGGRPIATPAYWNDMVFVGGGYGSHEFYALDAQTGAVAWKITTSDDGPTAAVVEDGCVAFNTESCTVITCDAKTGKVLWREWLGDPLMSQPAISKGRLFIAFPSNGRNPHQNAAHNQSTDSAGGHKLLCADLRTGRHLWEQQITADIISAPVINDDQVFFTCFDGNSFCLNALNGSIVWKKENSGTSAPLIADGQMIMTQKERRGGKEYEGLKRVETKQGRERDEKLLAESEAEYLKENKGGGVGLGAAEVVALDSSVGFGNAPASANLGAANKQVGVNSVAGGWAYQGSRAAYRQGQMMNAQGKYLNCVRAKDGNIVWRAEVKGAKVNADSQVFSPPALGALNLYLCSVQGHLLAVRQQSGEQGFLYSLGQPIIFQPALAQGNVYVGTANGLVICLKIGDSDIDGWYAWGGNAQHNKNE